MFEKNPRGESEYNTKRGKKFLKLIFLKSKMKVSTKVSYGEPQEKYRRDRKAELKQKSRYFLDVPGD